MGEQQKESKLALADFALEINNQRGVFNDIEVEIEK